MGTTARAVATRNAHARPPPAVTLTKERSPWRANARGFLVPSFWSAGYLVCLTVAAGLPSEPVVDHDVRSESAAVDGLEADLAFVLAVLGAVVLTLRVARPVCHCDRVLRVTGRLAGARASAAAAAGRDPEDESR